MPTNEESDVSQVSPLLKQIPCLFAIATKYVAYAGEPLCRALAEHQPHPRLAVVNPPRTTAVPSPGARTAPSQLDQHIRMIKGKRGTGWQKAVGYDPRSHAETAMFRCEADIGSSLRARTLTAQKT